MISTRSYHGTILDICPFDSGRIAYMLLPQRPDADCCKWMEKASLSYKCSIVCISGMDWNNDLSPWTADGVMKKEKPFAGHAEFFLKNLVKDHLKSIEAELKLVSPERTLVGVSLSGLFAVWASHKTDAFRNIISISGSLWYDGFVGWKKNNFVNSGIHRIYLSVGDKEKKAKEPRFTCVEENTLETGSLLHEEGIDTKVVVESNTTHLSALAPRLEKAFEFVYAPEQKGGDGDDD